MKILALFAAVVALVIGLSVAGPLSQSVDDWNEYQRNRHALDLAERSYQFDKQRAWDAATFAGSVSFYYLAGLAGVVLMGLLLHHYHQAKERQQRNHQLVDVQGYPLARARLEVGDEWTLDLMRRALELDKIARIEEARRPLPPHTDARRYTLTNTAPAQIEAAAQDAGLPVAPALSELVMNGWKPTEHKMLLGYSANGPIYGTTGALLSTAIAGRPNQGKSTLLRFVYWQLATVGGAVDILDPHGSILDSVGGSPVQHVASTGSELDELASVLVDELDRRLTLYRAGKRDFKPYLALCDEFPVISLASSKAVGAAGKVVLEGRKVGMYALISGQGLPAEQFGGRLVRDALSSRFIFKTTRDEARRCGLVGDSARMVEGLTPGVCVLDGPTDAPTVVAVPLTTGADLRLLTASQPTMDAETLKQPGKAYEGAETHFSIDPKSLEIAPIVRRLAASGEWSKTRIIETLWGAKPGGSRAFQTASAMYDAIMRGES